MSLSVRLEEEVHFNKEALAGRGLLMSGKCVQRLLCTLSYFLVLQCKLILHI